MKSVVIAGIVMVGTLQRAVIVYAQGDNMSSNISQTGICNGITESSNSGKNKQLWKVQYLHLSGNYWICWRGIPQGIHAVMEGASNR